MTRIIFNEQVARDWLATQAVTDDTPIFADIDVEITADWSPRFDLNQNVEPGDVWKLVYQAGEKGVFSTDDDSSATVDFSYNADGDGGAFQWQVYLKSSFAFSTFYIATPYEEYRKLGDPEAVGIDAAVGVLREAADGANAALSSLETYIVERLTT